MLCWWINPTELEGIRPLQLQLVKSFLDWRLVIFLMNQFQTLHADLSFSSFYYSNWNLILYLIKLEHQYYWFTRIIFNPIQILSLKHSKINHFLCSLFKGQILGFKNVTRFLSVNWNSFTDSAMLVHINLPLNSTIFK